VIVDELSGGISADILEREALCCLMSPSVTLLVFSRISLASSVVACRAVCLSLGPKLGPRFLASKTFSVGAAYSPVN
jgi:hypothetical protein